MVLVACLRAALLSSLGVWLLCACESPGTAARAQQSLPGPVPALSARTAASVPPAAPAPVASELATSQPVSGPPLEKPLPDTCTDPRAVLAVRKNHDRSGRILVQQALLANPKFKVVPDKAQQPFEIDCYETIYGTKNFSRKYPGDPMFSEAVVARCAAAETCNQLARVFLGAFPEERVELVCGIPPKTTGGFSRVAELAPAKLMLPDTNAPLDAYCARARACLAHEAQPLGLGVGCVKLERTVLKKCATQATCSAVAACIKPEPK